MRITVLSAKALTPQHVAAWSRLQRANRDFDSPFFRPEFTQLVASVRDDVEVAVLEQDGRHVGFFPFQRTRTNVGRPVAFRISDFQGAIVEGGVRLNASELIRACGLQAWHFDHLLTSQEFFAPFRWSGADSPYIALPDGYDAYIAGRDNGRRLMSEFRQRKRKLEREVGPIRYEWHVNDREMLATLIRWKGKQIKRMGFTNFFDFPWVANLLNKIMDCKGDGLSPVMTVMHAGNRIVALNFGMRSGDVLHPWFPAYNVELGDYSPGNLYWIETIKQAERQGVRRIDLGKGSEPYKQRLMTGVVQVSEGSVDSRAMICIMRQAWHHAYHKARNSRYRQLALRPWRLITRVRDQSQFR